MSQTQTDVHAAALEELGASDPGPGGGDLSLVLDVPVELVILRRTFNGGE